MWRRPVFFILFLTQKDKHMHRARFFHQFAQFLLKPIRLALAFSLIVGLVWVITPAPTAQAATITVNTTDDEKNVDGDCSLREAIIAANTDTPVDACTAGSGADTINVPTGIYNLSLSGTGEDAGLTGDLDITQPVNIFGDGVTDTIINSITNDRVFDLIVAGAVHLNGLTIQNGNAGAQGGGGIRNTGSQLILSDSRLTSNRADDQGGGLYVTLGTLTLVNSRIDNNTSANGGGLALAYSTGLIAESLIHGNTALNLDLNFDGVGGGIAVGAGPLTLRNSTVSNNFAARHGGGLYSTFHLDLYNVTIANNMAHVGGVSTGGDGGGVFFTDAYVPDVKFIARNSLLANNTDLSVSTKHPDCSGTLTSEGYNLIQDTTGCVVEGDVAGLLSNATALIGPLQDNGGHLHTHALLAGSPAIDAGNPLGCKEQTGNQLSWDQRGFPRPVDGDKNGNAACDIGAFEYAPPFNAPTATQTLTPSTTATFTKPQPEPSLLRRHIRPALRAQLRPHTPPPAPQRQPPRAQTHQFLCRLQTLRLSRLHRRPRPPKRRAIRQRARPPAIAHPRQIIRHARLHPPAHSLPRLQLLARPRLRARSQLHRRRQTR